jgi:beta-glucosidase
LYISDKNASVVTYDSVLRGFERVPLQAGETKTVQFTLKPADLMLLDKNMKWTVEPGDFEIKIGASSEDIKLKETITILP